MCPNTAGPPLGKAVPAMSFNYIVSLRVDDSIYLIQSLKVLSRKKCLPLITFLLPLINGASLIDGTVCLAARLSVYESGIGKRKRTWNTEHHGVSELCLGYEIR